MPLKAAPAQDFVPIKEIRDGVAILKDGSMRAVIMVSSLNFALKSAENQQALIYQFQNMLNSLDFSVQIFIQSRRLDIRPYLTTLEDRYRVQANDLMKLQTREYIQFIQSFTDNTNIMVKSFFIVVPYYPAVLNAGLLNILPGKKPATNIKSQGDFEEHRSQLLQRMSVVEQGMGRMGIRTVQLGSEEIVELFYRIFNPGQTEKPLQLSEK